MSFQISYTVKNSSTDFTWMDVPETKETKTCPCFLETDGFRASLSVTVFHLAILIIIKSSLKHKCIFKMSLKKPLSSLQAWSSLALLESQFLENIYQNQIYTLQSPNWEAVD